MKKSALALMTTMAFIGTVHAQEPAPQQNLYVGLGLPGVVALGYAKPVGESWGLRAEYAGGLKLSQDGTSNGVTYTGSVNASLFGAFADWYPFGNGFRLVGGLTANDIKTSLIGAGSGTATINGKTVNMTNETFNVDIKFPSSSPYLGIGYGHQKSNDAGFGLHADIGVMFGTFTSSVTTSLVGKTFSGQTISQADIDAQTQNMRNSLTNVNVVPHFAVGATYRF